VWSAWRSHIISQIHRTTTPDFVFIAAIVTFMLEIGSLVMLLYWRGYLRKFRYRREF
jgi:hypothetical protein